MSWQAELDELAKRKAFAERMGGADKVKGQHDGGRLTVRERIEKLIDPGSFHEIGATAGKAEYDEHGELIELVPSNCVFGRASVGGRRVIVSGDDFTMRGGSADATIPTKNILAEQMANELRLPIIRLIKGSGGGGSVKTIETTGRANLPGGLGQSTIGFQYITDTLSTVPVVALGLGSVAGLGAARLAASHYSVMTKSSAMFVAGPPIVARLGQQLTKQELAGGRRSAGPGPWIMPRKRKKTPSIAPAAISPTCRTRCSPSPSGRSARIRPIGATKSFSPSFLGTGGRSTRCGRSSRCCSTRAAFSNSAPCLAARSSPASRGSAACPLR